MTRASVALAVAAAAAAAVLVAWLALRTRRDDGRCGPGFEASGARCLVPEGRCPLPLAAGSRGCAPPDPAIVDVPETALDLGPSDWEAVGRVTPRSIRVRKFRIDAFELTERARAPDRGDPSRAAAAMTRAEAAALCAARGGRLPTEDEWLAAAAGPSVRRYPWGPAGAVCQRAAWGLRDGPCAWGADGPDTVGAHPSGDTPDGVHDLAGNVAEWVAEDPRAPSLGVARGGSWASQLATELRTWPRLELDPSVRDPRVGARCAYDAAP